LIYLPPHHTLPDKGHESRLVISLYLSTLALLPWCWFPPFPWLHEHAQWSDAVFAVTALLWAGERWLNGAWPRWRWWHAAIAAYLAAAALSWLWAAPERTASAWKLLGMVELCTLAVITADLSARPGVTRVMGRVIALTSIATALAALLGLLLFYAGIPTKLVGTYGDLTPSPWYARVQAGTYQPNLLASFCIFAAAVLAQRETQLPSWLRRVAQVALWLTVLLTCSRGILAFGLAALLRTARTRRQRLLLGSYAVACLAVLAALTVWHISLDPTSPLAASLRPDEPSSRWQALTSSLVTLAAHPWLGSGPGTSPGRYHGAPFDAHLTPLNIAATLGLPALLAFVALPMLLWWQRERPTNLAIWSGLAGLGLDALGQDSEDFRHLWVLLGLAGAKPKDGTKVQDSFVKLDNSGLPSKRNEEINI
jgi:hypothetical protein